LAASLHEELLRGLENIMAKVIEFYIPPRFTLKVKQGSQVETTSKIIEFPADLQRPA
jgi:hypothetical protein